MCEYQNQVFRVYSSLSKSVLMMLELMPVGVNLMVNLSWVLLASVSK